MSARPKDISSLLKRVIAGAGGGGGGGGKSGSGAYEAPDSLQSDQLARMVDLLSEGEIEGFATPGMPLQSIYLNGVPIQNADGSFNFNGLAFNYTSGTPDQAPLPGFPDVETVVNVNAQMFYGVPLVQEITDVDATSVIVTIQLPSLYQVDSSGDVLDSAAVIEIDVQPNGGSYAPAVVDTIQGKSSSTYDQSYAIQLTGSAPWNIRVSRLSPDPVTVDNQNLTYWATYTIVQDFQLSYPDSALVGIQADARLFGTTIPTRNYLLLGVKIQIPSNYDPIARTYTGIWDGTFQTAWTNNPAWWFYALLVNPRFGLGQYIDASLIDKYGLYAIAQYCDGLVPDGAGGMEPRYTFNCVISRQEDAIRVLVTMASVFRGMVYWGPAGVMTAADMPADPVKLITPANVLGGEITYSGAGLRTRHTVAYVTWTNPALNYAQDIVIVQGDPGDIQTFGWRPISFVAFGCTSRGQAHRMGAWLLDTEKNESETATWAGAWDQADLAPGDVVLIADPAYAGVRFGGRIAGTLLDGHGNTTGITLDASVTLESGQTYSLSAAMPDGTIGEAEVTNAAGATLELLFASPLPQVPILGAMWVITASNVTPRQFRIISRTDKAKNEFEFTALFNDPTKYARIEQNILLPQPVYTALPSGPLAPPTNLTTLEGVTLAGGTTATALCVVSWTAPSDPRVTGYNLQIKKPGSTAWQGLGQINGPSTDVLGLLPGVYAFRVQSVDAIGDLSAWLELDNVTLDGLSSPPDAITGLIFAYISGRASLTWNEISDPRPYRYEIRKGPTSIGAPEVGDQAHPPFGTLGDGLYWVAAYVGPSTAKIYGPWSSIEVVGSVLIQNEVVSHDEAAEGWPGQFSGSAGKAGANIATSGATNVLSVSNILAVPSVLNMGGQANGFYASPHVISLPSVMALRTTVTWAGTGAPPDANELADPDILTNPDVLGAALTQYIDIYPCIRLSSSGPVTATSNTNWGPWQPWTPDVQQTQFAQLGMALDTTNPEAMAVATTFKWTADVDDRVDSYANVSIPAIGYTLVFNTPFIGGPDDDTLPHVAPYLTAPQAGDLISVSGLTLSQCTISVTNGGVGVARTGAGAIVQGY